MRSRTMAAGFALAVLLSGCASAGMMTAPPPGGSPSGGPVASPTPSGPASAVVPAARWQAILDDLGRRGVDTGTVEVVSAREVTWNDGSLGCPKPGQFYTQALVPGLQVVVRAGVTEYDYRFGRGDRPKLCEK